MALRVSSFYWVNSGVLIMIEHDIFVGECLKPPRSDQKKRKIQASGCKISVYPFGLCPSAGLHLELNIS
jgi:hypothetical protein